MITIDFIKSHASEHSPLGGKRICLQNEKYLLSIVGGRSGLYGDFEEDFEIAIIDPVTREFITNLFFPEDSSDVIGYLPGDEVEKIANTLFKNKNFQVS